MWSSSANSTNEEGSVSRDESPASDASASRILPEDDDVVDDDDDDNLLHQAIERGVPIEDITILANENPSRLIKRVGGWTPLLLAILHGSPLEVIKYLVDADPTDNRDSLFKVDHRG